MSERVYTPDKWLLLKFTAEDVEGRPSIIKVLGSWFGGFTQGDSWRLSSGVEKIKVDGDKIDFINHSGSTYRVHREANGASSYTEGVMAGWANPALKIEVLTLEQAQSDLEKLGV